MPTDTASSARKRNSIEREIDYWLEMDLDDGFTRLLKAASPKEQRELIRFSRRMAKAPKPAEPY